MSYTSLSKLNKYLYKVTFNRLDDYQQLNVAPLTACSSFVKDGKLYRNLDWSYDETNEFFVIAPGFKGMSLIPGLTDSNLDPSLIEQLPFHINDGVNDFGIMVSSHILFDDFHQTYTGSHNITSIPYLILSTIHSIDDLHSLQPVLDDIFVPQALLEQEFLMQFLVSDGETTMVITPDTASSSFLIVDITSNPKIANFRWVDRPIVSRDEQDMQERPTGVERWNLIESGATLEELKFTECYENPSRLSEFIGINGTDKHSSDEELLQIYQLAHNKFQERKRDSSLWQTLHSVVYSKDGIESLHTQEDYSNELRGLLSTSSVTEKILGAMNAVQGIGTVMYESSYSANLRIDRKPSPYGILYLIKDFEIDTSLSRFNDRYDVEVFFCKPIAIDAKGMEFGRIVEEMTELAKKFIVNLKADRSLVLSDTIKAKTATGTFDKNVAGISLEFTVESKTSTCF